MNPFMEKDTCSRCNKEAPTIWHVCKECREMAQKAHQEEVKQVNERS